MVRRRADLQLERDSWGTPSTRQETAIVLERGLTVRAKPPKDHLEAIAHRDALAYASLLA